MQYLLVENRQSVLLGPINWKPRFIQSEFDDLEVPFMVPPVEQGYINVDQVLGENSTTGIEIFPLVEVNVPAIDEVYQHLAGPFYTYQDNQAIANYQALDLDIGVIKQNLVNLTASVRYTKENAGTKYNLNGTEVTLTTERLERGKYFNLLNVVGDSAINWKFPEGFFQVSKTDVQAIVTTISSYVQSQFDWEVEMISQINSATSLDQLKAIQVLPPQQTPKVE